MSILFEPISIGSITVKNRFVRSATIECVAMDDGRITDEYLAIYKRLANGDIGLIIPGNYFVQQNGRAHPRIPVLDNDDIIKDLIKLTAIIHAGNGKIFTQLNHGGRLCDPHIIHEQPVAPSSVRVRIDGITPRELSENEIEEVIDSFGDAALRAKKAGFDGVQIHAAHGFLINQFLSEHTNRRKDKWGGTIENRMKFLIQVYLNIRSKVGDDFPIAMKINSVDYMKNGFNLDECIYVCKKMEKLGLCAIEVSGGTKETGASTAKGGIPLDLVLKNRSLKQTLVSLIYMRQINKVSKFEDGFFLDNAAAIKQQVSIPVIAVGGMRKFSLMEDAVKSHKADMVSMCRPFIRQPNLIKLYEENKIDRSSCTNCNRCAFETAAHFNPLRCYGVRES
jgi:2,4-dienoyl-CoA reductase-like NADH-dependent reductase (Old Yellow Enzyme family)